MSRIPEGVRATVLRRSGGCCERCGRSVVNVPASVHHRRPRGMGGAKTADVHGVANLVLLCGLGTTGCHGEIESHREQAIEHGWLVPRRDPRDPADVPVYIAGSWYSVGSVISPINLSPPF